MDDCKSSSSVLHAGPAELKISSAPAPPGGAPTEQSTATAANCTSIDGPPPAPEESLRVLGPTGPRVLHSSDDSRSSLSSVSGPSSRSGVSVGDSLEAEFRWKSLFADVQKRGETAGVVVFSCLARDPLLEAQLEDFLERYIRTNLSPQRQDQLERAVRERIEAMDTANLDALEDQLKYLPANVDEEITKRFFRSGHSLSMLRALAQRHKVDLDAVDPTGTNTNALLHATTRAVHAARQASAHGHVSGPTGATGCGPPPPAAVSVNGVQGVYGQVGSSAPIVLSVTGIPAVYGQVGFAPDTVVDYTTIEGRNRGACGTVCAPAGTFGAISFTR